MLKPAKTEKKRVIEIFRKEKKDSLPIYVSENISQTPPGTSVIKPGVLHVPPSPHIEQLMMGLLVSTTPHRI